MPIRVFLSSNGEEGDAVKERNADKELACVAQVLVGTQGVVA